MKKRLDVLIKDKGLAKSRSRAERLIKKSLVEVEGKVIRESDKKVNIQSKIKIKSPLKYVSRGGDKLEKALREFGVDVKGMTVIDIGSSTGGFTDCLLQKGASRIYAVDVGKNQLDPSLKNNPKVLVYEETDIRKLGELNHLADLAVIDVSFISLILVLPKVKRLLKVTGKIIALIKPQFEVNKEELDKRGVVKSEEIRKKSFEKTKEWIKRNGFKILGATVSPLKGEKGNVEYFLYLEIPLNKNSF